LKIFTIQHINSAYQFSIST